MHTSHINIDIKDYIRKYYLIVIKEGSVYFIDTFKQFNKKRPLKTLWITKIKGKDVYFDYDLFNEMFKINIQHKDNKDIYDTILKTINNQKVNAIIAYLITNKKINILNLREIYG